MRDDLVPGCAQVGEGSGRGEGRAGGVPVRQCRERRAGGRLRRCHIGELGMIG